MFGAYEMKRKTKNKHLWIDERSKKCSILLLSFCHSCHLIRTLSACPSVYETISWPMSIACHFLRKKEHNKCANKIDIYDEIKRNGSQYDKHFSIHVLQGNNDYNKRCLLAPHSLSLCSRGTSERGLDVFVCVCDLFFRLKISNCSKYADLFFFFSQTSAIQM